jgi:hypothetical protein
MNLDLIIAVLTGRKVKDGDTWRVYDSSGAEIAHGDGVLLTGLLRLFDGDTSAFPWLQRVRRRQRR